MNIRYTYHVDGVIHNWVFTMDELEKVVLSEILPIGYTILGRSLGTGLTDTEGVEIFEKDFVYDKKHDERGVVTFSDGSFWMSLFGEPAASNLSDFNKYCLKTNSRKSTLKIIGVSALLSRI